MKRALAVLASLSPAIALACPVCAQGDRPQGTALLIAVPYLITAVVVRAIRSKGDEP